MSRPAVAPVTWTELTLTMQRDLLGVWASLVRKALRQSEGSDDREDQQHPSETRGDGLPGALNRESLHRAS
jgi:hypothetical protein